MALRNKFIELKESFESVGSNAKHGEIKVIVCDSITKDGLSNCKVELFSVCSQRVTANSLMCGKCGKWLHGGCSGMKRVTANFKQILLAGNVNKILERQLM